MTEFAPAPGVRLFIIDDDSVVYSHAAQKLYAFNTAATFIWCSLELGQDREEVARNLAKTASIAPGEASARVAEALEAWGKLGLLGEVEAQPKPARRKKIRQSRGKPVSLLPVHAQTSFADERLYALLGAAVRVRYASMEQREYVHPILAHLERAGTAPTSTVELVEGGDAHHVCQDGAVVKSCANVDQIGPTVKWLVWEAAVNSHRFFLNIHAGVVGDGANAILLPAAAGSGKSSLTAALSHAGFDYFSDEIALLEEPALTVRPIPLAVCVKSTGWDLMAPFFPDLHSLKSHRRGDGKIVRYVPPPKRTRGSRMDRTYPVRHIVFPRYRPGATTALTPLKRVEALRRLMDECLVVPVPLTMRRVQRLVRWIGQIDCFELPMSSLGEAVGRVCEMHRRTAAAL